MKTKLVKDHSDYHLVDDTNFIIGTTDERMLSCTDKRKLSIKNCQAIERGYDLDELSREMTDKEHPLATQYSKGYEKGIVIGFQKALQLMGDKKFGEEDLDKAFELGKYVEREDCKENYLAYKQSLQQTEWDVEVEMVKIESYKDKMGNVRTEKTFPTLDADGCLILKKI